MDLTLLTHRALLVVAALSTTTVVAVLLGGLFAVTEKWIKRP